MSSLSDVVTYTLLPTLLAIVIPLVIVKCFVVPANERAVPFAWSAPLEAAYIYSVVAESKKC